MSKRVSRRALLRGLAVASGGVLLAACAPQVVEKVVERTVEVPVEVEKEVQVEKEVTKIVQQTVEVPVAAGSEGVTIRFHARTGDQGDHFDRMAGTFNQEHHPDIFVRTEHFPAAEFFTKVNSMIAGGTVGDGIYTAQVLGFQQYASLGIFTPLEPIVEAQSYDLSAFLEDPLDCCRFEGSLFGLPWCAHPLTCGLYYNKAMFDEAGLAYPTADWTYDDLLTNAKPLSNAAELKFGFAHDLVVNHFHTVCNAHGGYLMSEDGTKCPIDTEEARTGLQFVHDCLFAHQVSPKPEDMAGSINAMFANNMVAMFLSGFWGRSVDGLMQVKEGWGCVPGPKGPHSRGAQARTDPIGVYAKSDHPTEIFMYLAHCCTHEAGMDLWQVANSVPGARKSVWEDPESLGDPQFAAFAALMGETEPTRLAANFRQTEFRNAITDQLDPAWTQQKTLDQAIADTKKAVEDILAQPPAAL